MFVLLATLAHAQDPDTSLLPEAPATAPRAYHIEFGTEVRVVGTLYGPAGGYVQAWRPPVHHPLIVLREDWDDEMAASVREVK